MSYETEQAELPPSSLAICFYVVEVLGTRSVIQDDCSYTNTELAVRVVLENFQRMGSSRFEFVLFNVFLSHNNTSSTLLDFDSKTLKITLRLPVTMWEFLKSGTAEKPLMLFADFHGFDPERSSTMMRLVDFHISPPKDIKLRRELFADKPNS